MELNLNKLKSLPPQLQPSWKVDLEIAPWLSDPKSLIKHLLVWCPCLITFYDFCLDGNPCRQAKSWLLLTPLLSWRCLRWLGWPKCITYSPSPPPPTRKFGVSCSSIWGWLSTSGGLEFKLSVPPIAWCIDLLILWNLKKGKKFSVHSINDLLG